MNISFAHTFKEDRLCTTGGSDLEHHECWGHISTINRVLTSNDGDLSCHCNENTQKQTFQTSLKQILIKNHEVDANEGKRRGRLPMELIFVSCKTFEKTIKQLEVHLTFKTAALQDAIYTTLDNGITVTTDILLLNVPIPIANDETQIMFNDSIKNRCTLSFDSWFTDRKHIDTEFE